MTQEIADRERRLRDLKSEVAELANDPDTQEISIRETSPPVRKVTLYAVETGQPYQISRKFLSAALEKRLPDGGFAFTNKQEEAPSYKPGEVKCFLHADSPEREVLDEIGLAGRHCPAAHLRSAYSKKIHAEHRHKQEWRTYQDYQADEEKKQDREARDKQLDATLALAGRAAANPGAPACNNCGQAIEGKLADHKCS